MKSCGFCTNHMRSMRRNDDRLIIVYSCIHMGVEWLVDNLHVIPLTNDELGLALLTFCRLWQNESHGVLQKAV